MPLSAWHREVKDQSGLNCHVSYGVPWQIRAGTGHRQLDFLSKSNSQNHYRMSIIQIKALLKTSGYSREQIWYLSTAVWKVRWEMCSELLRLQGCWEGPEGTARQTATQNQHVPIPPLLNIAIQLAWLLQTDVTSHFLATGLTLDHPFQGLGRAVLSQVRLRTRGDRIKVHFRHSASKSSFYRSMTHSPGFRCLNSDTSPPTRTNLLMKHPGTDVCLLKLLASSRNTSLDFQEGKKRKEKG